MLPVADHLPEKRKAFTLYVYVWFAFKLMLTLEPFQFPTNLLLSATADELKHKSKMREEIKKLRFFCE